MEATQAVGSEASEEGAAAPPLAQENSDRGGWAGGWAVRGGGAWAHKLNERSRAEGGGRPSVCSKADPPASSSTHPAPPCQATCRRAWTCRRPARPPPSASSPPGSRGRSGAGTRWRPPSPPAPPPRSRASGGASPAAAAPAPAELTRRSAGPSTAAWRRAAAPSGRGPSGLRRLRPPAGPRKTSALSLLTQRRGPTAHRATCGTVTPRQRLLTLPEEVVSPPFISPFSC